MGHNKWRRSRCRHRSASCHKHLGELEWTLVVVVAWTARANHTAQLHCVANVALEKKVPTTGVDSADSLPSSKSRVDQQSRAAEQRQQQRHSQTRAQTSSELSVCREEFELCELTMDFCLQRSSALVAVAVKQISLALVQFGRPSRK